MQCHPRAGDCVNLFALVSYIPGPLGVFLDRMRRDLVHDCVAQSHVTILPPRVLISSAEQAKGQLGEALQDFAPFHVRLGDIQKFDETSVIYIEIGAGRNQLLRLHETLNHDHLAFAERYEYHPHLTLAQRFDPGELDAKLDLSRQYWERFKGCKEFDVDCLTFVQNTTNDCWLDLEDFRLGEPVLSLAG